MGMDYLDHRPPRWAPSTTFCLEMGLHGQPIRTEREQRKPARPQMIWLIMK